MNKQPVFLFLLVIASFVLAGCSGVASAQPLPAVETQSESDSEPLRTISVAGSGRTTISPDIAIINIGVHTESGDADEAVSENNLKTQ